MKSIIVLVVITLLFVLVACASEMPMQPKHEVQDAEISLQEIERAPQNIRVAINTNGMLGLVHDAVSITGTGSFTVRGGDRVVQFAPGEIFTVSYNSNAQLWGAQLLYISPCDPSTHMLEIVGLVRNWPGGATPQYRGSLQLHRQGDGFVIVNELCLEYYLQAVIPSEMPTSHGLTAAKVQAITARSFALYQMQTARMASFGAHVDDSVLSQVYNSIPPTSISIAAVEATRGQVLSADGNLVIANFFSTSGGTTANFGEVWARGSTFPSYSPAHLRAMPQFNMRQYMPGNLREEEYATLFFMDTTVPGFESQFPWFRWQVSLNAAQLTHSINANIGARQAANPALIQLLDTDNTPISGTVHSIGELNAIEIIARGGGGNIMEIIVCGSAARVRVRTEFNIRTLLAPGYVPVIRHDNSQVAGLRLLPSAFFALRQYGNMFYFYGGGNGHGVGMSQNGVRALVDMGLCHLQILAHYYPGTMVVTLP